jgi:alkylation response protein AidB-like acyl-CoA dehydrogenase
VTLFAVDPKASGLDRRSARLADASLAARIRFDGVAVDADAVMGEVDGGRAGLDRHPAGRRAPVLPPRCWASAAGAMDMTVVI